MGCVVLSCSMPVSVILMLSIGAQIRASATGSQLVVAASGCYSVTLFGETHWIDRGFHCLNEAACVTSNNCITMLDSAEISPLWN
jgi:hypothetical protein